MATSKMFVRGLRDSDIRLHLLQDKLLQPFKEVVEKAIGTLELAKSESRIVKTNENREEVHQVSSKNKHLDKKVEKELERLETLGIITQVESSDWGTPIVPVVKPNGSVRICADYKVTLNKVIKDEHYPIPRIDDIITVLAKETINDSVLGPVLQALKSGQSVEQYGFHDNELSIQDDCVLKGWRVMIPQSLKPHVLRELHVAHLGEIKMKALARSFCWWKSIDKDIEQMVAECRQCLEQCNNPRKTIHPWEQPTNPWERVHIDFLGPTDGQQYLILVDAFSKWVEVIQTRTTTSTWTVQELRKIFSTFGFPQILVSDNGRQFVSQEFKNFMNECGIVHRTTAPYHPNSNGQAERYVQTVKKALKSMEGEKGTLQNKIQRLVMQLRQSPNSTGTSAYHLMFGRSV
ncbi:uncharacterized protein K02A2.6-like [Macrosteles quadrilineatus]|uniref:uncharacterized protein K02A2.6-like n=1 Tax=Macrosteles quadrilineatus TaxID=74068 RepID=UPI0023E2C31F|nr:uncharacterized protein K02A2.6-like [Macrosteles quadrilineatus]